jgi:hypothetical protein
MDHVPLAVGRKTVTEGHSGANAGIEPFTMRRRVEALPIDPRVVIDARRFMSPLDAHFMRALEDELLALQRREEAVGRVSVGPPELGWGRRLSRSHR